MNIVRVQYYRSEYGDCGFTANPFRVETLDDEFVRKVEEALLDRFNKPARGHKPPLRADVLDGSDNLLVRLGMVSKTRCLRLPVKPQAG